MMGDDIAKLDQVAHSSICNSSFFLRAQRGKRPDTMIAGSVADLKHGLTPS